LRENRTLLDAYAVRRIGFFGSYARGCQTAESDIDFSSSSSVPPTTISSDLRALRRLVGAKVDIVTYAQARHARRA
jgi:predicted nucleotidyltransferase